MDTPSNSQNHLSDIELSLWRQFSKDGDPSARADLIAQYSNLVRKIAGAIYRDANVGYVEYADLVQLGTVGLLEAISRYDHNIGVGFAQYAGSRIRGAILNGLEQQSEYHSQLAFRRRVRAERAASLLDEAKECHHSDVFMEMADLALGLAIGYMLEGTSVYIESESAVAESSPNETLSSSLALRGMLAHLPENDRKVLELHYIHGIDFTEIAKLLGLTKGRISQLHSRALTAVRKVCNQKGRVNLLI